MKSPEELKNIELKSKVDYRMIPIKHGAKKPVRTNFHILDYPSFLMSAPFYMQPNFDNNIWIEEENDKGENVVDREKSYYQWLDLYSTLAPSSLVYVLPSQYGYQDQVFTANIGLVLPHHIRENTFIPSNYRSQPRVGEDQSGRNFFSMMGFDVINCPYFFEGSADLKFIKGNQFVGGYGIRTDIRAYEWMEEEFGIEIIKVKMEDPYLYHFDCNFFPINNENAIVNIDGINYKDLKNIEKNINIFPISSDSAYSGTTNSIRCGSMIINHSFLHTLKKGDEKYELEKKRDEEVSKIISEFGLDLISIDLSECCKLGGLTSCCAMHMNYIDFERDVDLLESEELDKDDGSVELNMDI